MNPGETKVAAIILAAGRGERLRLGPKAFVRLDGRTLLEQAAATLSEAGISDIVAVLPASDDPDEATTDLMQSLPGVEIARNPNPDRGMLSSVCLGLETLKARAPGSVRSVVIHHVDHPWVEVADVRRLIDAAAETRDDVEPVTRVVPTWEGKPGHPILVREAGLAVLHAVENPANLTLRDVLGAAGETRYVQATGPGVVRNLNTPADLESLSGEPA